MAYLFSLSWLELGDIGRNLLQTITKSLQFSINNMDDYFHHTILYDAKKYGNIDHEIL